MEELKLVKKLKKFKLHAFALNYDHFHLLITPSREFDISRIMHFLKRNFSRYVNYILGYNQNDLLNYARNLEGDNNYCRFQCFGAFNKFLLETKNDFDQKYGKDHNISKFHWQPSFHDHVIRNEKDFDRHQHYIIYNFLKHELPSDWQYTALNYNDMIDNELIW